MTPGRSSLAETSIWDAAFSGVVKIACVALAGVRVAAETGVDFFGGWPGGGGMGTLGK